MKVSTLSLITAKGQLIVDLYDKIPEMKNTNHQGLIFLSYFKQSGKKD